jgi:hypothetical protein
MKRNYTLLLFLLATVSILAQTPEKMSYQVVLRDASNTLLTNQEVGMQISILQTTITGTAVYIETQIATTNINGLVSLEIGTGASSDNFSAIDWSTGPFFIKTATDASGGSNYSIIGTSQLMSVPFALYAKTAGNDVLKENTANKSTNVVTDAASDVKFPSVKSVKTYVDANMATSATSDATLQGYIDALEARLTALEPTVPNSPTIGTATAGDGHATISFTAPVNNGGSPITSYTATSSPGNITSTLTQSGSGIITVGEPPIITGYDSVLTNGTAYTFTVTATNAIGVSSSSVSSNSVTPDLPPQIGDFRAGGVVFWVDPADNTHGLVCALSDDATQVEWGCLDLDLPNVPNVSYSGLGYDGFGAKIGAKIGDGINNTNNILNDCPSAPAALAARSLGPEWFLPSATELNQMYIHKTTLEAVSGFSAFSNSYWSSTENTASRAWVQLFSNNSQREYNKNEPFDVRAVRFF